MPSSLSRLTLYALISSLEEDMRDLLCRFPASAMGTKDFFSKDLHETLLNRAGSEPLGDSTPPDTSMLIEYIDFGDLFSLTRRHIAHFPERYGQQVKNLQQDLDRLI